MCHLSLVYSVLISTYFPLLPQMKSCINVFQEAGIFPEPGETAKLTKGNNYGTDLIQLANALTTYYVLDTMLGSGATLSKSWPQTSRIL